MKKILIIQTAFAGDLILTLPLLQQTKAAFEPCEIDVLCIPSTRALLENHPSIDRVIVYDKRSDRFFARMFASLRRRLRERRYDVVFSPHRSLRSAVAAWLTGADRRVSFDTSAGKIFFTDRVKYESGLHEVERNLALLSAFGIKLTERGRPRLHPDEEDFLTVQRVIETTNITREIVCLCPGSVWSTKRWTPEGFVSLAAQLVDDGFAIVLLGGAEDAPLCDSIVKGVGRSECVSFAGRFTLLQSAELISRARLLISNDSAPVHLASAMMTPVVGIYGPTVPAFGFRPYGVPHRIAQREDLACRPCAIHGSRACPIKTFVCMRELDWRVVHHAAIELLLETKTPVGTGE